MGNSNAVVDDDVLSVIGVTINAGFNKYKKLMGGLDAKAAGEKLSPIAKARKAAEFPYLNAALHEALQLCTTLVGNMPREVPARGLEHDVGHTTVGCPDWAIHRLPEISGEDTEDFVPKRWIKSEKKAKHHRYFMGFVLGSRTCFGRNLGFLEARKLMPSVLMAWKFDLEDPNDLKLSRGGAVDASVGALASESCQRPARRHLVIRMPIFLDGSIAVPKTRKPSFWSAKGRTAPRPPS
ncbi:cytochrome P450 [Dactylonectria estremocensis]|uniref:Cytochrome P450 n=1 Tax=Dactylonectria estremocensis TaxID=1079267 RepID=A0A9P9D9X5_9HYPO|nr:cytochrome P450 [Dactylonectria estremocensis]